MTTQVPYSPVISIIRDGGSAPLRPGGGDDTLAPSVHSPLSNINPRQELNIPKRPEFDFLEQVNAIRFVQLPDNETIISWLHSMYDATKLDNAGQRQLSEDGRKLLQDFRYLLKEIRYMLREKNQDKKIQQFVQLIYEGTRRLHVEGTEDTQITETETVERVGTWEEAKKGYEAMYTIGKLLITNEEFTSLLRDITIVIRDMFGDVAQVVGDIVRPSQEERVRVFSNTAKQGRNGTEQTKPPEIATSTAQTSSGDLIDRGARYVSEKVSPDIRHNLIQRLKRAVAQIQRDESYQRAVTMLFNLLKQWGDRATEVKSMEGRIRQDETWLRTESFLKQIIEAFAQNRSLDPLGQALSTFLAHVREDPELENYFEELNHYLKKLLKEPGYLNKDESSSYGSELIDRGRTLLQKKYKDDTDKLTQELTVYSQALYSDPVTRMLATRLRAFGRDLLFDHKNKMKIKPQLINDFRTTFFPMIFQHIKTFAIPRFEFTDKNYDVVIENMVLTSDNFLPRQVNIHVQNHFAFSLTRREEYSNSHWTHIELHELHANARDLVFYYKRKTGLVHLKDIGTATIQTSGRGISIHAKVSLMNSGGKLYDISSVQCIVHGLNISIHGKKHNLIYLALKPVFDGMIKNQIERTIENSVRDMLIKFEAGLTWLNQTCRPEKRDDFESDDDILFENGEHAKRVMLSNLFRRSPTLTSRPNSLVPAPSFSSNDDDDDYYYDEKGKARKDRGEPSVVTSTT